MAEIIYQRWDNSWNAVLSGQILSAFGFDK